MRFSRRQQDGSAPNFFFQDLGKNIFVHYNLYWKELHPVFNLALTLKHKNLFEKTKWRHFSAKCTNTVRNELVNSFTFMWYEFDYNYDRFRMNKMFFWARIDGILMICSILFFRYSFVKVPGPKDSKGTISVFESKCYYQSNHIYVETIPLSALPKDTTSELADLSPH